MALYLEVPYKEKDEAKSLGAKWDPLRKKWYMDKCLHANDIKKIKKWIPQKSIHSKNIIIKEEVYHKLKVEYFSLEDLDFATTMCYELGHQTLQDFKEKILDEDGIISVHKIEDREDKVSCNFWDYPIDSIDIMPYEDADYSFYYKDIIINHKQIGGGIDINLNLDYVCKESTRILRNMGYGWVTELIKKGFYRKDITKKEFLEQYPNGYPIEMNAGIICSTWPVQDYMEFKGFLTNEICIYAIVLFISSYSEEKYFFVGEYLGIQPDGTGAFMLYLS